MEVGSISQGRQAAFDSGISNADTGKDHGKSVIQDETLNVKMDDNAHDEKFTEKDINNIKKSVNKINKFMDGEKSHVEYEIYGKHRDIVVNIVDNDTKKVIKEIPPKKILDMVEKMCDLVGIMFDKTV